LNFLQLITNEVFCQSVWFIASFSLRLKQEMAAQRTSNPSYQAKIELAVEYS